MPTQRGKLADRDPIPGHNKGFALVKLTHDLAAVIAELALGDLSGHARSVAHVLRRGPGGLRITGGGRGAAALTRVGPGRRRGDIADVAMSTRSGPGVTGLEVAPKRD